MKKFLFYLYTLCALASFVFLIYQAAPVFPYINDTGILLNLLVFAVFYYLANKAGKSHKKERNPEEVTV